MVQIPSAALDVEAPLLQRREAIGVGPPERMDPGGGLGVVFHPGGPARGRIPRFGDVIGQRLVWSLRGGSPCLDVGWGGGGGGGRLGCRRYVDLDGLQDKRSVPACCSDSQGSRSTDVKRT